MTYDILLTLNLGMCSVTATLSQKIVFEIASPIVRGSMLGLISVIGSIGIVSIQFFGGRLYDNVRKDGPFLVSIAVNAICSILGLILWATGKLNQ